jgi:hypothetical protein
MYKFYDFADHDTIIIPASNNPNFEDRMQYPVQMDAELDRYLKQSQLTIFIFDDRDSRADRYIARADIPLITLAHDKAVRGTFDLIDDHRRKNGTVDMTMKWTNAYIPPASATRTPAQRSLAGPKPAREPLALLPDEAMSSPRTIAQKQRQMNVKVTSNDVLGAETDRLPIRGSS